MYYIDAQGISAVFFIMSNIASFTLEKGRHLITLDENQQPSRGENNGILMFDQMSKYF